MPQIKKVVIQITNSGEDAPVIEDDKCISGTTEVQVVKCPPGVLVELVGIKLPPGDLTLGGSHY